MIDDDESEEERMMEGGDRKGSYKQPFGPSRNQKFPRAEEPKKLFQRRHGDAPLAWFTPYPALIGKWLQIQIRTGDKIEGTLRHWEDQYITLRNDGELILISREEGNIVSVRLKEK